MLKYDKLKSNKKPDDLLSVVLSVGQMLLVVAGLIGIAIQFFRDKGWLKTWLSSLMNASMSTLVIALPVMLLGYLVLQAWMGSHSERESSNLIADIMLYVMMLVGVWFIYNFLTTGGV